MLLYLLVIIKRPIERALILFSFLPPDPFYGPNLGHKVTDFVIFGSQ